MASTTSTTATALVDETRVTWAGWTRHQRVMCTRQRSELCVLDNATVTRGYIGIWSPLIPSECLTGWRNKRDPIPVPYSRRVNIPRGI